jgi:ubiquinone biosynthesis protein
MKGDLNVMRDLTDVIQQRQEWARDMDVKGLLDDFATNVLLELNYMNETFNARQLAFNMRELEGVHVPAVYPELCASRVMTQEFVKGVKITSVEKLEAAGVDRAAVAREFLRAMLKQVLFDGFFHADPHPGNVLVNLETSQVIFLDMGLMGNMTQDQRLALADIILSLQERDGQGLAKAVIGLSTPFKDLDERAFSYDVERMMKRYMMFDDDKMNLSAPMNDLMEAMRRAGLRLDPSLTLALKALFQAEQIVSELDPSLPLINVAFGQLKGLMRDQLSMEYVAGTARKQAIRAAKEVVRRLPSLANATSKWLDQYESGKLGVYLDTSDLNNQVDRIDRTITQSVTLLALTMLLVGLLIGSAIVTNLDNEVVGIRLSDIAFFLFLGGAVVATAIGLRIVWAVWNSLSARK